MSRRPAGDRHPCPCPCTCPHSAAIAGALCPNCTAGYHCAEPVLRAQLFDNLAVWSRLIAGATPDSSSGISAKALARARLAYTEHVARRESRAGRAT